GQGRIEREIRPGLDTGVMPALRLVITDDSHVIGENPPEARVHKLCRALLLGRRILRRLDLEFQTHSLASRCRTWRELWRRPHFCGPACPSSGSLIERNPHRLSPGLARYTHPRRGAVSSLSLTAPRLAAGYHTRTSSGHAFAEWRSPVCLPKC